MSVSYLHAKNKAQYSIKRLLHKRIAGHQKGRPLKTIHASAITYKEKPFCAREHSIYTITDVQPVDEFLSTALSVTFQQGRYIQAKINDEWLGDIMVGDWKCPHCGNIELECKKPKVPCDCGVDLWLYEEPNIVSEYSGISGGIDVVLDIGLDKFVIVEVKTIDKDKFRDLKAPLSEHRERTQLYLRLISESETELAKQIDTSMATILYVSKSYGFKDLAMREYDFRDDTFSPFKEFKVKADHKACDKMSELGKSVKDFREGLKPIPAKICGTILAKRAKKCCCIKECFSNKYPDNKYMREL